MSRLKKFLHNFTAPRIKNSANYIGATSFAIKNPYFLDCYDEDRYASIYPSVKAIAGEFMKIRPYAVGADGEPKQNVPAVDALYHPNQLDSSVAFFEKLAVMNLTHRNTYLLVWRRGDGGAVPGGKITPQNIAGYTFLENPTIDRRDGRTYYRIGAQEFSDMEVITIPGGVDPTGLYRGYAAGVASRRWATLDEYIADFQQGFFENGAVPAGQFIITAASRQDFEDTVERLQEAHRGAGKNNNVTYTPRPVNPQDGKPSQAKIEWVPFQQTNKDIDFKNLFEQANNRIDSTFGVPASIRGVGENNNYATARTDQQNFIRFTVEPLALRIYTQITHELNRITGGLGVAITFKIELPAIADEEKVQAETKNIEVNALLRLVEQGYSLDTAVEALDLSPRYKLLELGVPDKAEIDDNDKPDVDEGGEVDDSPDPSKIDGVTPIGAAKRTNPKAELTDEEKLREAARQFMRSQIEREIDLLSEEVVAQEPTDDELDEFVRAMAAVIIPILIAHGEEGYAIAAGIAGLKVSELQGYFLTDSAQDSYLGYLRGVGQSYGNDTAKSIQRVLLEARENGLNRRETENALRNIMNTDEWRIERLARTELNHSQNIGKLDGFKALRDEVGGTWEKTISHTNVAGICPLCSSQEGRWFDLDEPIWDFGDSISTTNDDGEQIIYVNDWQTNEGWGYHPNCRGTLVVRRTKNGV